MGISPLAAQGTPEIVRGRVLDDSARAVLGAAIHVTRGPDRLTQQTTTDSAGRYLVRFADGTGDYLVAVSAPAYRPARRRVQRQGTERELVVDFQLARDLSVLAAVRVQAQRPTRATNTVGPFVPEPGASERWQEGVNAQVPPSLVNDLGAVAGTMPGVTLTPGGASILGASAESNLTTLNGMALPLGGLPRAARTETRVTGSTYDPTRGGFSGANIDVRLGAGSRTIQERTAFVTLDAPQLHVTDAVGRATGAQSGGIRASVGANGELIRRALTYNVALDVTRTTSDPATLLTANAATLRRGGIAPDSVTRLVGLAGRIGLPVGAAGVPVARRRDGLTWLGRLDDTRDSLRVRTLTSYAALVDAGALGAGPLVAPSTAAERRERTAGAQFVQRDFLGAGRRVLNEVRLSASGARGTVAPYLALPGAAVLVRSPADDGEGTGEADLGVLALGGGGTLPAARESWTLEGANETIWNAGGTRHRFKALAWGRADGLRQEPEGSLLGRWTFNSLADVEAGRAASYTRTLAQPVRAGRTWNGATALAHQWAPSRFFSVLWGARLEAGGFGGAPPRNVALEQALDVRTGVAPLRWHVSPRAGFTWTYNRDARNRASSAMSPLGRFHRPVAGVVRGGIGEFRDLLRPGMIADAAAGAGLPGSTLLLSCVGGAAPVPDWARLLADPTAVPDRCVDGSGVLAERAPAVALLDPRWDVPRSWRASLDWNTNFGRWMVRAGALASYDLAQPGLVDANFAGVPRLALDATEGGRPVFVPATAVDPASGAVSAAASRRTPEFGRVGVRASDLRGRGGQLTLTLTPDIPRRPNGGAAFATSAAYTLQGVRRQLRGFDGAAFGDPRVREWAPGSGDARHIVVLQTGVVTQRLGALTLFSRLQSGLPFTPLVQGDVNGDGQGGDRAFVPDVGAERDPVLAAQLRALLADGAPAARRCVDAFAGRVAARNGCRGPWTQTLNVQWSPRLPVPAKWYGRLQANVYLENVLGGIDQLVHGAGRARGWGTAALPDPVLLVPRGFDAEARRFRYDVNPRFADTRSASTLLRTPFRVTLDFSLDWSTDYDLQRLRRALEPMRASTGRWVARSADSIAAFYLANTSSIHRLLLAQSDSLFLSQSQIAALRRSDSVYAERVRAVYLPLGRFLAAAGGAPAGRAQLDSVAATERAYWQIFWEQPEIADAVLTPAQRQLIPVLVTMLSRTARERKTYRQNFQYPVALDPLRAPAPR
ncbi:carboxypeptidase-like regulatory domain-containing protein [Roseisolibacter sp. H3M3-2]|uniref:carboxypeptidase-like regulatory domain-containing protein n=1 Tax=Roseisolibacter sp. H3M3-2 TaxID=3031323 RepID=UPI0023DAB43C|nr:carboxypeptidase-like regulatory domain-containing protein [Roseisolibacter sp. H3M3-2]